MAAIPAAVYYCLGYHAADSKIHFSYEFEQPLSRNCENLFRGVNATQ